MTRIITTSLIIILAGSLFGQKPNSNASDPLARSGEDFCAEVYQRLARSNEDSNLVYSPWSLRSALAMLRSGAQGATATELDRVLRLPPGSEELGVMFARVESAIAARGTRNRRKYFDFTVSNRAWPDIATRIAPSFARDLRQNWDAPLTPLDFRNDPEEARQTINREIASKTNDRIRELLNASDLNPETRLVLTNALWLRGNWADPFLAKVKPAPFYREGEASMAMMMRDERSLRYGENAEVQVASLPLAGRSLDFTIVLPKQRAGLAAIEKKMTGETLREWMRLQERGETRRVAITLPRFKIHHRASLTGIMKSMGLATTFTTKANFQGISSEDPIFVSDVVQGAEIEVNEFGLEAAAATAIVLKEGAIASSTRPVPFTCDHPFWWMIRDRATGAILFSGRLIQPELAPVQPAKANKRSQLTGK